MFPLCFLRFSAEMCFSRGFGAVWAWCSAERFLAKVCFSVRFWTFPSKTCFSLQFGPAHNEDTLASVAVTARGSGCCAAAPPLTLVRGAATHIHPSARVEFMVPAQRQHPHRVRAGWVGVGPLDVHNTNAHTQRRDASTSTWSRETLSLPIEMTTQART